MIQIDYISLLTLVHAIWQLSRRVHLIVTKQSKGRKKNGNSEL